MQRDEQLEKAAAFWTEATRRPRKRLQWGHVPQIKQHVSGLIGSPGNTSITGALISRARREFDVSVPFEKAISIGCGTGAKEISLARAGLVKNWDLYEISKARIQAGRENAARHGLNDRVQFHQENAFVHSASMYDLVFWSHSLHHMFDVDAAIEWSLKSLKPGGLMLIDEYVGPNRFQWTDEIIIAATAARAVLDDRHLLIPEAPDKNWPRKVLKPGPDAVVAADPTESVESEKILPVVHARMSGAKIIDFGGVVYMVALNGLLTNFVPGDSDLLERLLRMDLEMTRLGLSVLAGVIYRKPA